MKQGDLVILIKDHSSLIILEHMGNKIPVKDVIYEVRDFLYESNQCGIRLVEIVNCPMFYSNGFIECGFNDFLFAVIQESGEVNIEELLKESEMIEVLHI